MSVAHAEDARLPLKYSAGRACPSEAEFLLAVTERTHDGNLPTRERMPRAVAVTIVLEADTWLGELRFVGVEGPLVKRDIGGKHCADVAEALSIVTALALDAQGAPESKAMEPSVMPGLLPPPAESWPAAPPARPLAPATEEQRFVADDRRQLESEVELEPARPSPSPSPAPWGEWQLAAAGSLRSGFSPDWGFGGEAALWYLDPSGWQARAAVGASSPGTVKVNGTRTTFLWSGGTFDGCRQVLPPFASVCASLDLGVTTGLGRDAEGIVETSNAWKSWLAVGPAVRLRLLQGRAWQLLLGVAERRTLLQPRFLYTNPEQEVYSTSDYAVSADLGVGWLVE